MFRIELKGGENVRKGNYWNVDNGERVHLEKEAALPGDDSVTYLRFHPAALLLIGPLMGLAYAIFLPLTAIVMVVWVVFEKVFGGALNALWKAAAFSWQPSEAYLAGRKGEKKVREEEKAQREEEKPEQEKSE